MVDWSQFTPIGTTPPPPAQGAPAVDWSQFTPIADHSGAVPTDPKAMADYVAQTVNRQFAPDKVASGGLADVVSGKIDQAAASPADFGQPPPGVIIHGANADYLSDTPNAQVPRAPDENPDTTAAKNFAMVNQQYYPTGEPRPGTPQSNKQTAAFGNGGNYLTPQEFQEALRLNNAPFLEQITTTPGGISGALRRVGNGLGDQGRALGSMFGLGDRVAAGADTLTNGKSYTDNLSNQQQASADAQQRLGLLGKVQTTVGDSLGAAAVMPSALLGMGATPVARVLGGAGGGALIGGIGGAAQTPAGASWQDMEQNSLKGVGEGLVLGGAAPIVADKIGGIIGGGAQKVADALYRYRYGNTLPANVADPILTRLGQQGQTVADAQGRLQQLGPGSTLADTGPALQADANQLANRDVAVRPTIDTNLTNRLGTLDQRVGQAVNQNFGADLNAPQRVLDLKNQTAANATTAYTPIFANAKPVDVSPVLQKIDNALKPGGPGMTGSGVNDPYLDTLQRLRGYIAGPNSQAFDMQTLHNAQQLINDAGRSANQAGNGFQAGQIWDLRKQLMNQMDAANPGYLNATKQYASDKNIQEAFDDGRNILASRQDGTVYDPDLLQQNLANMSAPERDAFQTGARKALTDVMGQARSDPAGLRTKLANDGGYAVGKLRQVFGDQPVNNMLAELDAQATMRGTNNVVLGNAATAFRQSGNSTIPGFGQEVGATKSEGHGSLPLSIMAGAETGRHIGSLLNAPEAGSAIGAVAGPILSAGAKKVAAALAEGRAVQNATARAGLGQALTSPGQQSVIDALMAREASQPGVQRTGNQARQAITALLMQQAGQGVDPLALLRRQLGIPQPAGAINY